MKTRCKYVHWPAVCVVAGISDELIVERDFRQFREGIAIVSIDNLFEPVIRQCAVPNQDAQAASGEIGFGG